jgi:hypothetical protein
MRLVGAFLVIVLVLLGAGAAVAQQPPGVDHYVGYWVANPPTPQIWFQLTDQFLNVGQYTGRLQWVLVPVDKNGEGILDPALHYTMWDFSNGCQGFGARATISNQFGDQSLATWGRCSVLNPALKGLQAPPSGSVPDKNHYSVYVLIASPMDRTVSLVDQFNSFQAHLFGMSRLAVPAQKVYQGYTYPILDPSANLVFYGIDSTIPTTPSPGVVWVKDEFGTFPVELTFPAFLAVPSYKSGVVEAKSNSWGRLKSLYR